MKIHFMLEHSDGSLETVTREVIKREISAIQNTELGMVLLEFMDSFVGDKRNEPRIIGIRYEEVLDERAVPYTIVDLVKDMTKTLGALDEQNRKINKSGEDTQF